MASSPTLQPIPSSFDPAIHLHSEQAEPLILLPSNTHSDELEALKAQEAESTAAKNKQRIVIQHRAWTTGEAFRSDEDHKIETPISNGQKLDVLTTSISLGSRSSIFPSSPPSIKMPDISSPLAYPPSSSPPPVAKRRKVSRTENHARPRAIGGFVVEDDDDDDVHGDHGTIFQRINKIPWTDSLDKGGPAVAADVHEQSTPLAIEDCRRSNMSFSFAALFGDSERQNIPETFSERNQSSSLSAPGKRYAVQTCSGKSFQIRSQPAIIHETYEEMAAARTSTKTGRARKGYYGIEIHKLLESAKASQESRTDTRRGPVDIHETIEGAACPDFKSKETRNLLWTEKYRAKRYTDLVGDERTHRAVLGWLKSWDPIVYPGSTRPKFPSTNSSDTAGHQSHRKLLLLAGPPGHGKTTLAHVCARQAGYEILEINASDERSRDVVNGRIRDCVATENVKGATVRKVNGRITKGGRPVCVVVDEVDGVVAGSGGSGEGGFIKALIDLVLLDQKNSNSSGLSSRSVTTSKGRKRKTRDNFRLLRPIILVCNDVYHPALRSLRQSSLAEIIHIRKPLLGQVVPRIQTIFEREGFPCDTDGVRKLCEAVWGVTSRREGSSYSGNVEGDLRGILVVAEWVAGKLGTSNSSSRVRLTRGWVEKHVLGGLSHDGGEARGIGRGGARETVERVFLDGAGFPHSLDSGSAIPGESVGNVGVAEMRKRKATQRLRELVESCGEVDRVVTDCFSIYPSHPYRDDSILSKPNHAYEWLYFHDSISSRIFTGQEWELSPYLSQPVLAFHHLFSTPAHTARSWTTSTGTGTNRPSNNDVDDQDHQDPLPFTGPKAEYNARETEKHNRAILSSLHTSFSIPLARAFKSPEDIATELLPYLVRLVTPDVKPVIVSAGSSDQQHHRGGVASVRKASEKELVRRAVNLMAEAGIKYEKGKLETDAMGRPGGWVYRMEPPLDTLATYETYTDNNNISQGLSSGPTRYAIRQVLDQEYQKELIRRENQERQARYLAGSSTTNSYGGRSYLKEVDEDKENPTKNEDMNEKKGAGAGQQRIHTKKRDFFGRVIINDDERPVSIVVDDVDDIATGGGRRTRRKMSGKNNDDDDDDNDEGKKASHQVMSSSGGPQKVWISFHEGVSNAVRRPITLEELMREL